MLKFLIASLFSIQLLCAFQLMEYQPERDLAAVIEWQKNIWGRTTDAKTLAKYIARFEKAITECMGLVVYEDNKLIGFSFFLKQPAFSQESIRQMMLRRGWYSEEELVPYLRTFEHLPETDDRMIVYLAWTWTSGNHEIGTALRDEIEKLTRQLFPDVNEIWYQNYRSKSGGAAYSGYMLQQLIKREADPGDDRLFYKKTLD